MNQALGRHILIELSGCDAKVLDDVSSIEAAMLSAAEKAGMTIIQSSFHHFSPIGVSGVVVIQESHLAIHTWPEYAYAAVDLFTCGNTVDAWKSFEYLKDALKAKEHSAIEMFRGSLNLLQKVETQYNFEKGRRGLVPKTQRSLWFTEKDESQALSLKYTGDLLFNDRSEFQSVRIYNTQAYGKMLALDGAIMCTERDEFHYHEMLVHPAAQSLKTLKKALIVGGGDGACARELLKYTELAHIDLVEIDDKVIQAATKFLPSLSKSLSSPKVHVTVGDGVSFVKNQKPETYDLIIIDGSDPVGPASQLFEEAFYQNCAKLLADGGVIVAQAESPMFQEKTFVHSRKALEKVFSKNAVATALIYAPTYPSGMWGLHFASRNETLFKRPVALEKIAEFVAKEKLQYYNEQIHEAAFVLPTFVKKMLEDSL